MKLKSVKYFLGNLFLTFQFPLRTNTVYEKKTFGRDVVYFLREKYVEKRMVREKYVFIVREKNSRLEPFLENAV